MRKHPTATRKVGYSGAGRLLLVVVAAVTAAAGCAAAGARMGRAHADLLRQSTEERH